jgi:hypothetical protein
MFGQTNQTNDNQTADASLPFDPSTVSLSSDQPAAAPAVPAPAPDPGPAPAVPAAQPANDLLSIKQTALQQLSPLVGHLDQTPEEKFKTTMMMIQASDDQAAQSIKDDKIRAQALLDIINEINYFTQQHPDEQES